MADLTREILGEFGIRELRTYAAQHKIENWSAVVNSQGKEGLIDLILKHGQSRLINPRKSVDTTKKGFVVTVAQNATELFRPAWQNMLAYAKCHDYEVIVAPGSYHPSGWQRASEEKWFAPEVMPYLVWATIDVNSRIQVISDARLRSSVSKPLNGFKTISGSKWAVIPHPTYQAMSVPTYGDSKFLTTTGTVTVPNYSDTATGKKGDFHHTYGFVVIEQDDTHFDCRHVHIDKDNGSFIDLGVEWNHGTPRFVGGAGLILGDTHYPYHKQEVIDEWVDLAIDLGVSSLVHHDLYDCAKGSHHERNNGLHRAFYSDTSVFREIKGLQAWFNETFGGFTNLIVEESNHNSHLDRWALENDWRTLDNKEDQVLITHLAHEMLVDQERTPGGWGLPQSCLQRMLDLGIDHRFINPSETIASIVVGCHGQNGPNGARGSMASLSQLPDKTTIGHVHSPGSLHGLDAVGCSCEKGRNYVKGPSGWMWTAEVIYHTGKRQLIHSMLEREL